MEQPTSTPNQKTGRNAQIRKHYFLDQYVVVAPSRSQRPKQHQSKMVSQKPTKHHPIEAGPSILELPGPSGSWQVKVVPNKYPALTYDNPEALGEQEVVLETPLMSRPFDELTVSEIKLVLEAYRQRIHYLRQRYNYISIFKNHGHNAGATLAHTHSQIIASDFVPLDVRRERETLTQYQHQHDTSALCDVIRWELEKDERTIAHTRYTTTLCPYASQYSLEAWVIPNRQTHSIVDLNDDELRSLADHLKGVAHALAGSDIDFNYHLQEGIAEEYNHFYIKVSPRIGTVGGFELNTGMFINPVRPEYAKRWYQEHIKTPDVS